MLCHCCSWKNIFFFFFVVVEVVVMCSILQFENSRSRKCDRIDADRPNRRRDHQPSAALRQTRTPTSTFWFAFTIDLILRDRVTQSRYDVVFANMSDLKFLRRTPNKSTSWNIVYAILSSFYNTWLFVPWCGNLSSYHVPVRFRRNSYSSHVPSIFDRRILFGWHVAHWE